MIHTVPTPPPWAALVRETLAVQRRPALWLAAELHITRGHLSNMMTGKDRASPKRVLKIAAILGLPARLLTDTTKENAT